MNLNCKNAPGEAREIAVTQYRTKNPQEPRTYGSEYTGKASGLEGAFLNRQDMMCHRRLLLAFWDELS
jgi:hypothetical protein